jgi:hypothetical protein
MMADNMFVLDFVPEKYLRGGPKDSVVIFTAGWAMKFVPLLGIALKDMALHRVRAAGVFNSADGSKDGERHHY